MASEERACSNCCERLCTRVLFCDKESSRVLAKGRMRTKEEKEGEESNKSKKHSHVTIKQNRQFAKSNEKERKLKNQEKRQEWVCFSNEKQQSTTSDVTVKQRGILTVFLFVSFASLARVTSFLL